MIRSGKGIWIRYKLKEKNKWINKYEDFNNRKGGDKTETDRQKVPLNSTSKKETKGKNRNQWKNNNSKEKSNSKNKGNKNKLKN